MTNLNIDPKMVEIAGAAYVIRAVEGAQPIPPNGFSIPAMESAIRAVFEELGLERQVAEKGTIERYCSDWKVSPLHASEQEGRQALERLVWQRLDYVGVGSNEQIQAIVDRALTSPPPEFHWEECGMCLECDAAWVLARRKEEEEIT